MPLNKSKGNMYEFVTHTWNTIKGACPHDCSYCYMKRWGKLNPARFDEKELKTDLGSGNFIFVGSSCDMFAADVPPAWIAKTLMRTWDTCNYYLFQTKNPANIDLGFMPDNAIICTTIETNRHYPEIMKNCPNTAQRGKAMNKIALNGFQTFVTIEPIMDFDLNEMVQMIKECKPEQVNIGADSGAHNLPEPSKGKVQALISEIQKFTTIHNKSNLQRLL